MKLKIEGMNCDHCVAAVRKALEAVPGVARADVDLGSGEAEVEGGPSTEALVAAVREAGYEARAA